MTNVEKMRMFYEDANDQHVRAKVAYLGEDDYLYSDKALTAKIEGSTLWTLFCKDLLVAANVDETIVYKALTAKIEGDVATVWFVDEAGAITKGYSAEYTA